jgi:hypothetical protein
MKTQNKLLAAGAILAIVLLMLIAYWTYDTRQATRDLEERMETVEAIQSLRLLTQMFGREGDCAYEGDMNMRLYDRLWNEAYDTDYPDNAWE